MDYSDEELKKFRYHSKFNQLAGIRLASDPLLTLLVTDRFDNPDGFEIGKSFFSQPKWKGWKLNEEDQLSIEANHSSTHLLKALNEATVRQMTAAYTNVSRLQVELLFVDDESIGWLSFLLESWRQQLRSLHLVIVPSPRPLDRTTNRLYSAINSLTALKSLNFKSENLPYRDLPIIGQLKRLIYCNFTFKGPLVPFIAKLEKHGHGSQTLEHIELDCEDINHLATLSSHLRSCFKQINLDHFIWYHHNSADFPLIVHFPNLTSLCLNLINCSTTLRRLFVSLSTLHKLTHLYIMIDFESIKADDTDQANSPLAQLEAIKYLKLSPTIASHHNLHQLNLPWTVPNVQFIDLSVDGECSQCGINFDNLELEYLEKNMDQYALTRGCYRQMLSKGTKDCKQSGEIWRNFEEEFDTFWEILNDDEDRSFHFPTRRWVYCKVILSSGERRLKAIKQKKKNDGFLGWIRRQSRHITGRTVQRDN